MTRQGKNLRDILQVKLGNSLNTAIALKTGEKKSSKSHKFGEEKVYNAFPHSFIQGNTKHIRLSTFQRVKISVTLSKLGKCLCLTIHIVHLILPNLR